MVFLKVAQSNKTVYQEFGWRNTGTLFKSHLISYLVEWLKEVIHEDVDEEGLILRKHYGITRIPDPMAMKEMLAYRPGVNVDRLVALASLVAFVKVREANGAKLVKVENELDKNLQNSDDLYKLNRSAFSNLGRSRSKTGGPKRTRSAFKHIGRR